jgi:hypothetical protein
MRSSSLVGPPLITCDDTGLIKSSTSGVGMASKDPMVNRGLIIEDLTIDRWPIEDMGKWTTKPDLCYCVLCRIVYRSRGDIINHCCPGHAGKSLGKRKYIDELKEEDCDVVEFLSWFLPRVIVDKNPKQFSHRRFTRICRRKLIDCCLGGFMMWLLSNTWCHSIVNQNHFIRKLFESPRQVIDWELYPLSAKKFDHGPPTICIYDVGKKVKGKNVIDKYKNCYDEDYDKVAYHDLKTVTVTTLKLKLSSFLKEWHLMLRPRPQ